MNPIWIKVKTSDGYHRRVVSADWTIHELMEELHEESSDYDDCEIRISYKGRYLEGDETIGVVVGAEDNDPIFEVIELVTDDEWEGDQIEEEEELPVQTSPKADENVHLTLSYDDGRIEKITAKTVGEVKTLTTTLASSKGRSAEVVDVRYQSQSLLKFGPQVMLRDIVTPNSIVEVVTSKIEPSSSNPQKIKARQSPISDSSSALLETLFDAQAEKERISNINQIAYNGKVLTLAMMGLVAQVEEFYPQLQQDLIILLRHYQQTTELMRMVLEKHSIATKSGSSATVSPEGVQSTLSAIASVDSTRPPQQNVQRNQAAAAANGQQARAQIAENAAGNNNNVAVAPGQPGGIAAPARPRVAALIVIDVRLLFKLALVVAVLGHDAGPKEFYMIVFVAVIVYLANTNMIRLPFLNRLTIAGFGRVPHAGRRGFFVDVWTMISTFFLSIIPAWQVIAEEPAVNNAAGPAAQVQPMAQDQPAVGAIPMAM